MYDSNDNMKSMQSNQMTKVLLTAFPSKTIPSQVRKAPSIFFCRNLRSICLLLVHYEELTFWWDICLHVNFRLVFMKKYFSSSIRQQRSFNPKFPCWHKNDVTSHQLVSSYPIKVLKQAKNILLALRQSNDIPRVAAGHRHLPRTIACLHRTRGHTSWLTEQGTPRVKRSLARLTGIVSSSTFFFRKHLNHHTQGKNRNNFPTEEVQRPPLMIDCTDIRPGTVALIIIDWGLGVIVSSYTVGNLSYLLYN